jgi:hypothetical protein
MGMGTKVVEHKAQKTANKAMDNMGAAGKVIDKHTTTGPLDRANDAARETKDQLQDKTKHR